MAAAAGTSQVNAELSNGSSNQHGGHAAAEPHVLHTFLCACLEALVSSRNKIHSVAQHVRDMDDRNGVSRQQDVSSDAGQEVVHGVARLHACLCDHSAAQHAFCTWTTKALLRACAGSHPRGQMQHVRAPSAHVQDVRQLLDDQLRTRTEAKLHDVAGEVRLLLQVWLLSCGNCGSPDSQPGASTSSPCSLRPTMAALQEWDECHMRQDALSRDRTLPLLACSLPPELARSLLHELLFPSPQAVRRNASIVRWMLRNAPSKHTQLSVRACIASASGFEAATAFLRTGHGKEDADTSPMDDANMRSSARGAWRHKMSMPTIAEEEGAGEREDRASTVSPPNEAMHEDATATDGSQNECTSRESHLQLAMSSTAQHAAFRDRGLASNTLDLAEETVTERTLTNTTPLPAAARRGSVGGMVRQTAARLLPAAVVAPPTLHREAHMVAASAPSMLSNPREDRSRHWHEHPSRHAVRHSAPAVITAISDSDRAPPPRRSLILPIRAVVPYVARLRRQESSSADASGVSVVSVPACGCCSWWRTFPVHSDMAPAR